MDNSATKDQLKQVLELGAAVQTVAGVVSFALTSGKTEFLAELNAAVTRLTASLTPEEHSALKQAVTANIDAKLRELLLQMGEKMTEAEMADTLKLFTEISQAK